MGTLAEKNRLKKTAGNLVTLGVTLYVFFIGFAVLTGHQTVIQGPMLILGLILWIVGLAYYSKSKGYSAAYCLLGVFPLGFLGGLILLALPDKYLLAPQYVSNPVSNYPRTPEFF